MVVSSRRHGVGPNGSRDAAPPPVGSLLRSVSEWHVPRRHRRSPTMKLLDLEEEEDWGA
jgi:hypothetical protein